MNRKEEKTIEAVHEALKDLIQKEDYRSITTSDLIERSGISRSTFYAHFRNKDDVLESICHDIFHHVFSSSLRPEAGHDFSRLQAFDYPHMLVHLFYHFQEEKGLIAALLSSSASHSFDESLRQEARPLIEALLPQVEEKHPSLPKEVLASSVLGALLESLHASVTSSSLTPEEWASAWMKLFL